MSVCLVEVLSNVNVNIVMIEFLICWHYMHHTQVLTRGSQFRVEASLVRITKPLNYVLRSPSRVQVN